MCGICGFVGDSRFELLKPMCHAMAHRGPDDIFGKIIEIKEDSVLREKLVQKGHERISSFCKSWEEVSRGVIEELESLACKA